MRSVIPYSFEHTTIACPPRFIQPILLLLDRTYSLPVATDEPDLPLGVSCRNFTHILRRLCQSIPPPQFRSAFDIPTTGDSYIVSRTNNGAAGQIQTLSDEPKNPTMIVSAMTLGSALIDFSPASRLNIGLHIS